MWNSLPAGVTLHVLLYLWTKTTWQHMAQFFAGIPLSLEVFQAEISKKGHLKIASKWENSIKYLINLNKIGVVQGVITLQVKNHTVKSLTMDCRSIIPKFGMNTAHRLQGAALKVNFLSYLKQRCKHRRTSISIFKCND